MNIKDFFVLILVLMEWRKNCQEHEEATASVICSNGMKKERSTTSSLGLPLRFNPCSNGMKKEHHLPWCRCGLWFVLILVLMEWRKNILFRRRAQKLWGFNPCSNGMKKELIAALCSFIKALRFNPCSNGMKKERWSRNTDWYRKTVLILVLMEWRKNEYITNKAVYDNLF